MEIRIDLDMNRIDYEAINKQIQEKIEDMNLRDAYRIDSKIREKIDEEVEREVRTHLRSGYWSGLNSQSKDDIRAEIYKNISELIKPHVENIFNEIPQEELTSIISDLLPKVLIDILTSNMKHLLDSSYYELEARTMQICEERIQSVLMR